MYTISSRCWLMLTDSARKRSLLKVSIQSLTPNGIPTPSERKWNQRTLSFTTTTSTASKTTAISNDKKIYLHVGPSGDSWIGDAIFAAKHNQPGYVKSIPLTDDGSTFCRHTIARIEEDEGSLLIEVLEEYPEWAQEIYDTECFPEALLEHLKLLREEDDKS